MESPSSSDLDQDPLQNAFDDCLLGEPSPADSSDVSVADHLDAQFVALANIGAPNPDIEEACSDLSDSGDVLEQQFGHLHEPLPVQGQGENLEPEARAEDDYSRLVSVFNSYVVDSVGDEICLGSDLPKKAHPSKLS
jgi:hypothetical protein